VKSFHLPLTLSLSLLLLSFAAHAQTALATGDHEEVEQLKKLVLSLEARVSALEAQNAALRPDPRSDPRRDPQIADLSGPEDAAALVRATAELRAPAAETAPAQSATPSTTTQAAASTSVPFNLPGGATLNYMLDLYYEYNFNNPIGRVNDLRAYDVLSNVFSINQAAVVFDLDPDLAAKRRYGVRLDLQFGQATETLQGNPAVEPRPEIYRNIFQAYGTYVVPVGSGLNVDIGKWASSLGVEGNYTKDQLNYTRSYFFYFLPFYHAGVRAHYQLNNKLGVNYWIVNGTNQSEPTNSYKDELFGYVYTPSKKLTWTAQYYVGQDHPDVVAASNCIVPVQPGLCLAPIIPAPNGKLHIFDSYVTWQPTSKLTLQGEGDYFIEREWANAAPGESSAPSEVYGGAGYATWQLTSRSDLAARSEYFDDRNGLFSGVDQVLKEATGTYEHKFGDSFDSFLEYRRDWSNVPYFGTSNPAVLSTHQDTATLGLVWWYGGKEGTW
jgi:hypothetical protein